MSTETMRLIRDGEEGRKGGKGVWMEAGERGDYIPIARPVTTGMTPALRLAAMRTILSFINCEGQRHKIVSTDHLKRKENRSAGIQTEVPLLTSLKRKVSKHGA